MEDEKTQALLGLLQAAMEAAAWSEDRCQRSADVCRYGSELLFCLDLDGSGIRTGHDESGTEPFDLRPLTLSN